LPASFALLAGAAKATEARRPSVPVTQAAVTSANSKTATTPLRIVHRVALA
jgi:hypothetical protein